MLLIITCHCMQVMNIELARWFNIGVQVFLYIWVIYGSRRIAGETSFYHRRFIKILVSSYRDSYVMSGVYLYSIDGEHDSFLRRI